MQMKQSFARSVLNEFQLRKFGFRHKQLELFHQSQWQSGERSLCYLLYRWIWTSFFIGVFIACLALQLSDGKLFIFLTNWGIVLCTLTQLSAALLVTRWHFDLGGARRRVSESRGSICLSIGNGNGHAGGDKPTANGDATPLLVQLYWLLHGVSLSLALVITTVYWMFLHGKMNKPVRFPVMSFVTHCLNSVFMVVDFLIVAYPVRILHTLYWMLLPILYCLFTVVYYFAGGTDEYGNHYVYPILDWTNPVRGLTTFAGVFVLYLIYAFVLFTICKFKRYLARTLKAMGSPHAVGLI